MGTRDSYEPGTFSWVDLATTDADAAKAFYAKVFGWDYDDMEMPGGGGTYSMAQADGKTVAAVFKADGPARWNSYITVSDLGEAVDKAREAGAKVHAEPMDVGDAGRMAVIQDPTGGVVSLWEAKDTPGARLVNAHGALAWNDLMTYDVGEASEFYCEVFGWEVAPVDMSGAPADEEDDDDADEDDESDDDADDESDDDEDSDDGDGVHVDPNDATDAPGYEEQSDDDDDDSDDDDEDDDTEPEPGSETTRGPDERLTIKVNNCMNGGIATIPKAVGETIPPHWLPYFAVDSIEAALTTVRDEGGTVMADPIEVPAGKFAVLADPQGAVFAVIRGELDD